MKLTNNLLFNNAKTLPFGFLYFSVLNIRHIKVSYGVSIGMSVLSALLDRIVSHGVPKNLISYASQDTVLVSAITSQELKINFFELLTDLYKEPLIIEGVALLLDIDFGVIEPSEFDILSPPEICEFSVRHKVSSNGVIRKQYWCDEYKNDMARIVSFFRSLDRCSMRFQAVVPTSSFSSGGELYWEALTVCQDFGGIKNILDSIGRLSLTSYFDNYIVRRVIDKLESVPNIKIACNISPRSLCDDLWWRTIINYLYCNPNIAGRLFWKLLKLRRLQLKTHQNQSAFLNP